MASLLSKAAAVAILLAASPCRAAEQPPASRFVPLPKLSQGPITLRVLYLENAAEPAAARNELEALLQSTAQTVRAAFGLDVRFSLANFERLEGHFAALVPKLGNRYANASADFRAGDFDVVRMRKAIDASIDQSPSDIAELWRFVDLAAPPARSPTDLTNPMPSRRQLSATLTAIFRRYLAEWAALKRSDGQPFLPSDKSSVSYYYNEWLYWGALPRLDSDVEVILTNQVVISAEYYGQSPHTALRGGLTVGNTSGSPGAKYGALSWLSLYPFLNDNDVLLGLRRGERYDRARAMTLAGAYLAHEIGHQLLHLGHPWDNNGCVMRPAVLLTFEDWYRHLDAIRCPVGSTPAMTPGAVKIPAVNPL